MARRSTRARETRSSWLRLGFLAGVLAVLYAVMALTGTLTPRLGLDLQGGTSVILTPRATQAGQKVNSGAVDKAVDIIRQRVDGLGVAESEVKRNGNQIEISVPGRGRSDVVNLVGQTAELRFRTVYTSGAGTAVAPSPTATAPVAPSASPSAGSTLAPASATPTAAGATTPASPKPTAGGAATPTAGATSTARADAVGSALLAAGAATPAATKAPSATPTPAASASAAVAATASPTPAATASPSASAATPPADVQKKYDALVCPEKVRTTDAPGDWTAACSKDNTTKYLLMPASVVGTDVKTAQAQLQTTGGTSNVSTGQWVVSVSFTGSGQKKFTKLTEETINKPVAIVLDGIVQSAPVTNERIPGDASISGNFTQSSANDLANVLKYGALPLAFEKSQAESISPTLGHSELRGGMLALAIGLGLVILYSFFYYRLLGVVVIASLVVSGLLVYATVCLLGSAIGFTLTLAGIAGLILSVGVTADSFVVYFERIKDEVREGRTIGHAVERAWPAARRTILSADTVSFLAAAVLYIVSIGSVRGFAFTLGLSTLSDVVLVFIFTRPLVTLLVRLRLFTSPRWSGLNPSNRGGPLAAARPRLARRAAPADGPGSPPGTATARVGGSSGQKRES